MKFVTHLTAAFCVILVVSAAQADGPHRTVYRSPGNVVARAVARANEKPVSIPCPTASRPVEYVCRTPAPPCPPLVQRTRTVCEKVMVPQTTTEKRTIVEHKVEYQNRPQTVTVMETVPQVVNVQRSETVMTTETRLQPQTRLVPRAVYRDIIEPVTVPVQGVQNRVGVRPVLRTVAVRVQVPVTKQCQCVTSIPGHGTQTSCSKAETRLVDQIQYRQQWQNEQFTYQVPVTYYQTGHRTRRVVEYQQVQQTVNVPVQVQIPRQRIWTEQVTEYRQVPRQIVQNQTVAVPVTVRREVSVPVTRMVPQTIQRTVTVPAEPCSPCGR